MTGCDSALRSPLHKTCWVSFIYSGICVRLIVFLVFTGLVIWMRNWSTFQRRNLYEILLLNCNFCIFVFTNTVYINQATGMHASIFDACPKPGWIGRVVPGRASGIKMMGWQRWWHQLVWMGWQSIQIVGASACVIFILHQKIQKMTKCTFWYQLTRVVPDKVQRAVKWSLLIRYIFFYQMDPAEHHDTLRQKLRHLI